MIDPEASKIALTADFPNITIAGNVANQVFPTQEFKEEVYSVPNPYSELFYKYYDLSFPFWDETAAALMVDPSLSVNQTSGMSKAELGDPIQWLADLHPFLKCSWMWTPPMVAPTMGTSMCTKRGLRLRVFERSTMCLKLMPRSSSSASSMLFSIPSLVRIWRRVRQAISADMHVVYIFRAGLAFRGSGQV
jgi:hypothetical protein